MTMLKTGGSGSLVRDLQEMLNVTVPVQPLLKVDGIFGPKTRERVVMAQQRAGLVADGIVGPKTSQALIGATLTALGARSGKRR